MRVLVTGSRDWDDVKAINDALDALSSQCRITVVHGDCPTGADKIADDWCLWNMAHGTVERHPAKWHEFGKRAGFKRNAETVALGADFCIAFIRNGSKGATHTADLAERAGIHTIRTTA